MDEPKKGALLVPGLGVEGVDSNIPTNAQLREEAPPAPCTSPQGPPLPPRERAASPPPPPPPPAPVGKASGKLPTPELAGQGKALPVETKPKNTFAEEVEHIKSYQRPEEPSFVLVGSMENKKDKRAVAAPADGATQQRTGKGNTAQHVLSVASVAPQGVRLDQTIGNTCSHNGNLAVNPANGNIAYPAGRIVVLASANLSHELFHFYCRKAVSSICWSSDGRLIAIGERGHHPGISVWREEKAGSDKLLYKQIAYLHKHKFGIKRVAFNTEGTVLASIGFKHDHAASFWKIDPHGGMPQSLPVASGDTSTDNSWGGKLLTSVRLGSNINAMVSVKSERTAQPIPEKGEDEGKTKCENAETFVVAGEDGVVTYWSMKFVDDEKNVLTLSPLPGGLPKAFHKTHFVDVAAGENGRVYAITRKGVLCAFSKNRMMEKWVNLDSGAAFCLSVSKSYVAAGCAGGVVRVFKKTSLSYVCTLSYTNDCDVSSINGAESPDEIAAPDCQCVKINEVENTINVVYSSRLMNVWKLEDSTEENAKPIPELTKSITCHSDCIWDAIVPNSRASSLFTESYRKSAKPPNGSAISILDNVITCSADGTMRFWDFSKQHQQSGKPALRRTIKGVVSKDFDNVAGESRKEHQQMESEDNSRELPLLPNTASGIRCFDISVDGCWIACGDYHGNLHVYDLKGMAPVSSLHDVHTAEVLCASFSFHAEQPQHNGISVSLLASGGRDGTINIFDVNAKFKLLQTVQYHSQSVMCVRFSLDGSRFISCGGDKTIVLSAVDKGESSSSWKITKEKVINSPHGTFYDMNLHENNRWLITAGKDRKVQVWSLNSGKKLRSWKPTDSVSQDIEVYKIVLDPTGTYAATCSFDKFIRIYDFLSGACIARFTGHSEIVSGICFTADCKRLVTVGGDGCVLVWRLPSPIGRAIRERKKECIAKRQRAQLKLGPQKPVDNMKPQTSTEKIGAELENVDTPTKVLRKDEQHAENDFKLPEPMDELTISATLDSDIGDGLPAWAKTERDVATKETVELSKDADPTVNGPTSSPARVPTKGDSPPRFIAPKTLAEERRSLALRQQGKEANAAVANMRSKLAELGILPKTEAEPSNIDPQPDSESANNQDNEPSSEAPSADIFEKHADVANQTIELNSSQTSMTPLTIELPDETEQCVPIPDPEENKKRAENSRNVAETSESLEVVTSEAKVPKYESAKASGKVAFDGRVLPPPQSSASPKRSAVSQKPPVDVQSSQQLTHPAEEYRQSLVDLRAAFSRAVNMFKEVDDVRQSLPSISDREGVEKLFAEFQNEFRELKLNSHDIAREQQTALVESEDDADSDDEETISTLLELAARLKRKKRKNRRSLSSSLTRNSE